MAINKYNMDMCKGAIGIKMIRFAIPLALTYVLQLTFHAADLMIIGRFGSAESMASIGTTMDLNTLLVNLLVGISIGTNVLTAQYYGAKDSKKVNRTIHTSIAFAIYGGLVFAVAGFLFCKPVLQMMNVPEDILPKSTIYMRLLFIGFPCALLYNYGCAVLRAVGDTSRPLIFLTISGIVNVVLNLLFVIVFRWDVVGVAIATILSQVLSAYLVLNALTKMRGACRLVFRLIRLDFQVLKEVLYMGVPAGLQGSMFALSNVIIQRAVNTFGSAAMAGITATVCLEWIIYSGVYACQQTCTAFVGQNYGGGKRLRIIRCVFWGFGIATAVSLFLGGTMLFSGESLIRLFNTDPEVIQWGMKRVKIAFILYFICGWMDVTSGSLRGLGYSILPTAVVLLGVCFFRIGWITFVFPRFPQIETLIWAFPISWTITTITEAVFLFFILKGLRTKFATITLK